MFFLLLTYRRWQSLNLIWMWTALGFIQSPDDKMELEDIYKSYFKEFCARSFFQYIDNSEYAQFVTQEYEMHDLIYDLAASIIQEKHSKVRSSTKTISENVRHLTIFLNDVHGQSDLRVLQKLEKVQSIMLMYEKDSEQPTIDESFISTCISKLRYLRFFDLGYINFEVLPKSIGNLKHLRYLSLDENKKIKKLPNSICKLQNLQTLVVSECVELEELPKDIKNLVSLRTLFLTTKQKYFQENGLGRLKSLRYLFLSNCNNLRSLPQDMRYCTTLRNLFIVDCEQLDLATGPINEVIQLSLQTLVISNLSETTAHPQVSQISFIA